MATKILSVVAPYGSTYTGLTLGYTIYDSTNTSIATGSMAEIGTTGIYTAFPSVSESQSGTVVCGAPTGLDPYVREVEPVHPDMNQAVPTSNTAQTVGDALNAARAGNFGKGVVNTGGLTYTLYAADGSTSVRAFSIDQWPNPTQRT